MKMTLGETLVLFQFKNRVGLDVEYSSLSIQTKDLSLINQKWYFFQLRFEQTSSQEIFSNQIIDPHLRTIVEDYNEAFIHSSFKLQSKLAGNRFKIMLDDTPPQSRNQCCFSIGSITIGEWKVFPNTFEFYFGLYKGIILQGLDLSFLNAPNTPIFYRDDLKTGVDYAKMTYGFNVSWAKNSIHSDRMYPFLSSNFNQTIQFNYSHIRIPKFDQDDIFKTVTIQLHIKIKSVPSEVEGTLLRFSRCIIQIDNEGKVLVNNVKTVETLPLNRWVLLIVSCSYFSDDRSEQVLVIVRSECIDILNGETKQSLPSISSNLKVPPFLPESSSVIIGATKGGVSLILKYMLYSLNKPAITSTFFNRYTETADYYLTSREAILASKYYNSVPTSTEYSESSLYPIKRRLSKLSECIFEYHNAVQNTPPDSGLSLFCPFSQDNIECKGCNPYCESCRSSSQNGCCTCRSGYSLKEGFCLRECNTNEFTIDNITCQPCSSHCKTCSGPTDNDCLSCEESEYEKIGNYCKRKCFDDQTYFANQYCLLCDSSCKTCSGGGPNLCESCHIGYNFVTQENSFSNNCTGNCCERCPDNCKRCNLNHECLECDLGFGINSEKKCKELQLLDKFIVTKLHYFREFPPTLVIKFSDEFDQVQLNNTFTLSLINLRKEDLNIEYNYARDSNQFEINLSLNESIENGVLEINFGDLIIKTRSQEEKVLLKSNFSFSGIVGFKNKNIQAIALLFAQIARVILFITLGFGFITLSENGFWPIIQSIQLIDLLFLIDIPISQNIASYSNHIKKSPISLIPNPLKNISILSCTLEKRFNERELGCLIFENMGGFLIILLVIFSLTGLHHFLVKYQRRQYRMKVDSKWIRMILMIINFVAHPRKTLKLLRYSFVDCMLYSFIQTRYYGSSSIYQLANSIIGVSLLSIMILVIIFYSVIIWASSDLKNNSEIVKNYYPIYRERNIDLSNGWFQRYYESVEMMKNALIIFALYFLNDKGDWQIQIVFFIQLIFIVNLYCSKPFQNHSKNVFEKRNQLTFCMMILLMIISESRLLDLKQSYKYYIIGNMMIGILTVFFILVIKYSIATSLKNVINFLTNLQKDRQRIDFLKNKVKKEEGEISRLDLINESMIFLNNNDQSIVIDALNNSRVEHKSNEGLKERERTLEAPDGNIEIYLDRDNIKESKESIKITIPSSIQSEHRRE